MKRKCIFTNKPADSKFTIGSDKQNWAKSVPCTKEYLTERGDKSPTELEIRLVELFYEQELCRLRIDEYDAQMDEIRALMSNKLPKKKMPFREFAEKMKEIIERKPDLGPFETTAEETKEALEEIGFEEVVEELTEEEKPVKVEKKVVKKKLDNLWD